MSLADRIRLSLEGETITSITLLDDEEEVPYTLDADEELLFLGGGLVFFEPYRNGWEWTLFVAEGEDWVERADGVGRITAEQVATILAYDEDQENEDDEGGEDDADDVDGDGDGDGLIGGSTYRFEFDGEDNVVAVYEVEDGEEEIESISPDETYLVVGDYVVKIEEEDDGIEWEVYGRPQGSDLWIEVADGRGMEAPTSVEAILAAIAAETGVADDIEGDDDDRFDGSSGDDNFDGDDGDDDYFGGSGRDRLRFETEDGVRVDLRVKTHQDTGLGYDRVDGIEDLTGGLGSDTLVGDFLANSMNGSTGDDVQHGNGGADDLWGELGDDSLDGGGGDDSLNGGLGDDSIAGGSGRDRTSGGHGHDDIDGEAGDDRLDGNAGRDTIDGGDGADALAGGDDVDALWGGAGNDVLRGGRGGDQLHGGAGRDVFVFKTVEEGGLGRFDDVIADFTRGQDRIDLRDFDLDYIGRGRFSVEGDAEVRLEGFTGGVRVIADVDGDGRADFSMEVNGVAFLSAGDFML